MQVATVVPADEIGVPDSCDRNRRELLWITYRVLESPVPGLDECVVIAASGSRIAAADEQRIEEYGQRHSPHGVAVIAVLSNSTKRRFQRRISFAESRP